MTQPPPSAIPLTPQQQAVVAHDSGAALVFAVAGAGKTTAMVHRIERLVRSQTAVPHQILATSFAKANVADLNRALGRWPHCRQVDVRTLHSLGRQIMVQAQGLGYGRQWQLDSRSNDNPSATVLNQAIATARQEDAAFKRELDGLDRQDFLDYVGSCKGEMQYADLGQVRLGENGRSCASQAEPPSAMLSWYLDLYQLYERVRQQMGLVTYDDMVLSGWELLSTHSDLLATVQSQYQQVLVDEFQDINRAQSELLHLITEPHRNYMAIGDDDQTVYEWRGANPSFILNFARRYRAQTYEMTENFRCPAAPLTLANEVIHHNRQRRAKRLQLTKGFHGNTQLYEMASVTAMSTAIVTQIQRLQEAGESLDETAVLVRLHAQTPPLEQALISAAIPYQVPQPFYQQREIKTLIAYARLAWIENRLLHNLPVTPNVLTQAEAAWYQIVHRPKRYLSNALSRQIVEQVQRQQRPFSHTLTTLSESVAEDWLHEKMAQLALDLRWLAASLEDDGQQTLQQLDQRLGYSEFLRTSSGFAPTGQGRAAGVQAFIAYAQGKGSLLAFMGHIRSLAEQRVGQAHGETAVTLTTMHRAKGLEWTHVFIPQCNQEIIPFNGQHTDNMEEERRLFYVALTRTRRNLYLYQLKDAPLSQFLREARWQETLAAIAQIATVLGQPSAHWQASETLALLRDVPAYQLQSYFRHWWDVAEGEKTAVFAKLQQLQTAVQQQKLHSRLKLPRKLSTWWDHSLPAATHADFPGLAELLAPEAVAKTKPALAKPRRTPASPPTPPPTRLEAGVWVYCDAGWGQITAVQDGNKRPLAHADPSNHAIHLLVTLRPDKDAEPIAIDIAAAQITFLKARTVYTCTLCHRFSAASTRTLERVHSRTEHQDSLAFRQEKGVVRPLTNLTFATAT